MPAILTGLGLGWVLKDPDLAPPFVDQDRMRRVRALVDEAYAKRTLEEVGDMLTKADAIWAPLNTLDEAAIDPQLRAAGCFVATPDRFGGAFEAPASPIRFRALDTDPRGPAPGLGEHTREVLAEAGLAPDAIDALIRSGAALGPREVEMQLRPDLQRS
jgi:crotonobetainyl-CoA:carnitine CoA-transferase CaiB-like acyl-CoA transferase